MELFPYILIRQAGITTKLLANLPTIAATFVKDKQQADIDFKTFKDQFLSYINEVIRMDERPCVRVQLMNIRRAVVHDKKINQKDLRKITTHTFKDGMLRQATEFETLKLATKDSLVNFKTAFEEAKLAEADYLYAHKGNLNLLNGLLFSSPTFYERLQKTEFDGTQLNKKIRQTSLKLLEYFSRASTKTSPFSSFGKIGFYDLKNGEGVVPIHPTIIYTNQQQLQAQTGTGLNPTIFEDENYYYFFILEHDGAILNRIQKDKGTTDLFNSISAIGNDQVAIQSTLNKMDVDMVNKLIENGFLIKLDINYNNIISNSIEAIQNTIPTNISKKKNYLDQLKSEMSSDGNEAPVVYEDCFITPTNDIPKSKFDEITNELNELTKILAPLHFFTMREMIKKYCQDNLQDGEAINLVELIQEIKELPANYLETVIHTKKKDRQNFKNELEKIGIDATKQLKDGVVALNFKDFDFAEKAQQPNYFAAHFQIQTTKEKSKAVINAISSGAGKLFGRFAIQYPQVTEALKTYIYNNNNGNQLVLNQDFSNSPVNSHPPLIDQKITIPTNIDIGISPGNLYVNFDSKEGALNLTDATGAMIKIINLGVESESTRNYLYPYLSAFTGVRSVLSPLLEIINEIYSSTKNGIHYLPRIEIGNHLILQRKSWHFPIHQIPQKEKGETDADLYLKIQNWITIHQLPQTVFIKTQSTWFSKEIEWTSNNQHKPQFIDFNKLSFVLLFNKRVKQVKDFMEISEPLPEFNCFSNNNFDVKEYAIEWAG